MKDTVGSTLLLYIVIIVVGIVGAIFIASNNYSKAYKAKNNIIYIIDNEYTINHKTGEDNSYNNGDCFSGESNNKCALNIASTLKNMGYIMSVEQKSVCDDLMEKNGYDEITYPLINDEFKGYCIFKTYASTNSYYYTVVTFNHMNLNVLGVRTLYKTPVFGQTRIYYMY